MKFTLPSFFKKEEKTNPPSVLFADETTRGALSKTLLPHFIFNPPFGTPRTKDTLTLRRLGNSTQASIAKQTIIDEVVTIPWKLTRKDDEELTDSDQDEVDEITNFLNNPNTNNESFEFICRQMLNDVLDIDSGIWTKEFDPSERMVELRAVDGLTFLKNPDIHGKFDQREDLILRPIDMQASAVGIRDATLTPFGLTIEEARIKAAYFQFGFLTASRPIAFGRREIVWFEKNPQSQQIYGRSPMEGVLEVLQTLIYSIEYNLDYFEDNNVPKGFIQLGGGTIDDLKDFRERWNELQLKVNSQGMVKKNFHRVPITNTEQAAFVRVQFSAAELQLIEMQQWFSKLVWAMFEVTPTELGFTEDSNRATEVNQSKVFKRKAILPLLRMMEYQINSHILSEWDFGEKYQFEFNTFDVDEERNKFELFDLQIRSGIMTPNEIRISEGMEPREGGDGEVAQEVTAELLEGENNPQNENEKLQREKETQKAQIDEETVIKAIISLLDKKEKDILKAVRAEAKQDRLTNIKSKDLRNYLGGNDYEINKKSVMDVINSIESVINVGVIKALLFILTSTLFIKGQDDIEKQTNEPIKDSPDTNQMAFLNKNFLENIKGMNDDLKAKLKQQLRIAVMNGEGIAATAQRIKSVFQVSKNRSETIARTEVSRIENFGQLDAAKKAGIPLKKYLIITMDNRTSDISKAMDRKYGSKAQAIPLDENFKVTVKGKIIEGPAPPFHPNERDAIVFTTQEEIKHINIRKGQRHLTDKDLQKKSLKKRLEEL